MQQNLLDFGDIVRRKKLLEHTTTVTGDGIKRVL
jgi:hypothetical protein